MYTQKNTRQTFALIALYVVALTICALFMQSCGSSRNVGNNYQKHLQHRHSGAHHLSNGNGGCNWHN